MKTLIILHGWQSSKEKWQAVKDNLEYNVVIPDLPGFKTELDRAWTLDDYVEWLRNFSKDMGEFFLLGHSFGGRIAIKFAEKYALQGLILVSAAGIKTDKKILKHLSKRFKLKGGLRTFFYKYILRRTDYLNAKGFLKQTMSNVVDEDLTPLLNRISVPVHIIWGKNDKLTPLKHGYIMKEKTGATMDVINTGHAPYIEDSVLLAEKIKKYVN